MTKINDEKAGIPGGLKGSIPLTIPFCNQALCQEYAENPRNDKCGDLKNAMRDEGCSNKQGGSVSRGRSP